MTVTIVRNEEELGLVRRAQCRLLHLHCCRQQLPEHISGTSNTPPLENKMMKKVMVFLSSHGVPLTYVEDAGEWRFLQRLDGGLCCFDHEIKSKGISNSQTLIRDSAHRDGRQGEDIPRRQGCCGALPIRHYLHLAHERKGDALGALALLEGMEAKGCEPNERTYNTPLMGLCKNKKLDKAIAVYKSVVGAGMKLETPAYAHESMDRALCRAGRVPDA
uniref:PH01B001G05.26 protein n=1 Tax=Phyllostachys edulis TaxID=38705 RepID=L0P3N6_PHYED|nr:PH01B001G05.26 [Phyllostachys edulis]